MCAKCAEPQTVNHTYSQDVTLMELLDDEDILQDYKDQNKNLTQLYVFHPSQTLSHMLITDFFFSKQFTSSGDYRRIGSVNNNRAAGRC